LIRIVLPKLKAMKDFEFQGVIPIIMDDVEVEGELEIPKGADSLVIFSHGSGSSRFSARNNFVAKQLQKRKIATFLFDLLTKEEDEIYENRFNIDLLAERLVYATQYVSSLEICSDLGVGFFGASTGAASALRAAAILWDEVQAVVSRGGRPDLVKNIASKVVAPTLLIVGEWDEEVLELNRGVYDVLQCEKELKVVQGATHLFEEPGKLNEVSDLAGEWFSRHLHHKAIHA
jgi:fermentation-respiration switch protein FrsA (DUF1100 family)